MECVLEAKATTILQFIHGLRGSLHLTLEEGTWAAWLHEGDAYLRKMLVQGAHYILGYRAGAADWTQYLTETKQYCSTRTCQ